MQNSKVTINIAVYNEERRIGACLSSIFRQRYPRGDLEVLVVDGMSNDKTVEVARRYPIKVIANEKRDPATGRLIGLLNATGDFHIYLDADMELNGNAWIEKMVYPMINDSSIIGSFTRFLPRRSDPALNRCLSYNEEQLDPMLAFISPKISQTIVASQNGYYICNFEPTKTPIVGVIMFRTEILRALIEDFKASWGQWMWSDVDFPIACAKKGLRKFAYVPDAGIYHKSYASLRTYLGKKRRDVYWSYLPTLGKRHAVYINLKNSREIGKLIAWFFFSNSMFPCLLKGLAASVKNRDLACMYIPILASVTSNYLLLLLLADIRGRLLLGRALAKFWETGFGLTGRMQR